MPLISYARPAGSPEGLTLRETPYLKCLSHGLINSKSRKGVLSRFQTIPSKRRLMLSNCRELNDRSSSSRRPFLRGFSPRKR